MKDPVVEAPDENPVTSQLSRGTGKGTVHGEEI